MRCIVLTHPSILTFMANFGSENNYTTKVKRSDDRQVINIDVTNSTIILYFVMYILKSILVTSWAKRCKYPEQILQHQLCARVSVSLVVHGADHPSYDNLCALHLYEVLRALVPGQVVSWKQARLLCVSVPLGASEARIHTRSCSISSVPTLPSLLLCVVSIVRITTCVPFIDMKCCEHCCLARLFAEIVDFDIFWNTILKRGVLGLLF